MALALSILLVLYSHLNVEGVNVISKASELGINVCVVEKQNIHVTLKRKFSSHIKNIVKDCGIKSSTKIDCEQRKIDISISYVPYTTVTRNPTVGCCPGWKNYKPSLGCFTPGSCLSVTENTPQHCLMKRKTKLAVNQAVYTLGKPPTTPTEDLSKPKNYQNVFVFPILNLTSEQTINLSYRDPLELPWLLVHKYMIDKFRTFLKEQQEKNENFPEGHHFNNTSSFIGLFELVRDLLTKNNKYKPYFRYPSLEEKFKDIMTCDKWKDDQVFVEQRLAGLNPMSLKKLTMKKGFSKVGVSLFEIQRKLNSKFDWNAAMSTVVGRKTTLREMIRQNSVFVIHYPLLNGLSNPDDIQDLNDGRKIKKSTSPIALFVSVKPRGTKSYQLKPVAIQIDADSDSPVFQPKDGNKWLLAKQIFQVADFAYVEMIEHLLKTHLVHEPICVVAKRCLSEFHPLSQLLKWHCRGLFVTNSKGLIKLVEPHGYMHQLFSIGNVGAIELLNKAYAEFTWEETDFFNKFKKRGVKDKKKLPYFPYRDDGYLIWKQVMSCVKDYVRLYYRTNQNVVNDSEIQSFANELASDGIGENGGIGMLKGFPRRITTVKLLVDTLTRIIWLPIQHNAVNYPIAKYGAFVPNMPTRLYDDPRTKPDEFSFHSLSDSRIATVQSAVSFSLGSFRYDKLFDYGSKMEDIDAAEIINEHYKTLMRDVKKILQRRNEERFKQGHLTYPYLVPGWIPNSIYT